MIVKVDEDQGSLFMEKNLVGNSFSEFFQVFYLLKFLTEKLINLSAKNHTEAQAQ